jgi:molecular chaperone DnaK
MGRIIGIDLGTSTSEISYVKDGAPVIIPNSLGKYVTPSAVHITEEGEALVGEHAAEYLLTRPDRTFTEVKRLTGSGAVLKACGREYTPEDIQAELLKYLARCAGDYLGEKIDRAVITVPAYFTDVQRRATVRAGELAGLDVARVINEPTAAALDYGLMNIKECKNVLVFDFGGGTLDVTVMELFEGVIDVKASSGDNALGGKDFDEILMKRLFDPGNDQRALMRLKKASEECKIALSEAEGFEISLPFLTTGRGGRPVSLERTVTKAEFEEWIKERLESAKKPLLTALADAGLSPADLDIVLMVGGSTRIPAVRRLVAEVLGTEPSAAVDPDLAVARGAAIQAAILEGRFSAESEIVLTDVCPYTLGIAVLHRGYAEDRETFSPIMPRNTTIPAEISEIYFPVHRLQTSVKIKIYQGESADLANNQLRGEAMLTGIPPARKESDKEPFEVTFSYDMNGILQVRAHVISTGKEVRAEINTAGVKPKPPIDLSRWESAKSGKRCRPAIRKAEKLIGRGSDAAGDLELFITQIKEALVSENEERAEELRRELVELMEALDE